MAWAAKSAWGGGASNAAERARLPKGNEDCFLCAGDAVEVKLRPCDHAICLECANKMRQTNIFKADTGLKCPFCREYVDGFTDMNGRPDTVSDLVEANRAARKSATARRTGADAAVSTSVPDLQRLVPPVAPVRQASGAARLPGAPPGDWNWTCPNCHISNPGQRAECSRCRFDNPVLLRQPPVAAANHKDPLVASEEELVRAACERHHPGLNRAFVEAGTPWSNGSIASNPEGIRKALRSKGHERLMRVVHLLTSGTGCEQAAVDQAGTFSVQDLLEASHLLRVQALHLQQAGTPLLESFGSLPAGHACTAQKAVTQLLRALVAALHKLATNECGVFVLVKLIKLGSPQEVVYLADQAVPHMHEWMGTKDGALFVSQLVEKLCTIASEGTPSNAARAVEALARLASQLLHHNRVLVESARSQFLGPSLVRMVEAALPHVDAFKMAYQLALNAQFLCMDRNGSHTLDRLVSLKGGDLRCREMGRDLACYAARALQGRFEELATKLVDLGGARVVKALLLRMLCEREDDWLRQITEEVLAAAGDIKGEREGSDLLAHCLALPWWSPLEVQQHWAKLEGTRGVDVAALREQVQATKVGQQRLPSRLHARVSEIQPSTPAESLRQFPAYIREARTQHPQHSAINRAAQAAPGGAAAAAATQQRAAPPGFAGSTAAGIAAGKPAPAAGAAAAAKPAVPPGFAAAGPSAAAPSAAPIPNGVTFPNGARVPMPAPYSSATPAASSRSSSAEAAAPQPAQPAGSSSSSATAPPAGLAAEEPAPAPAPAPQQPAPPAPQQPAPPQQLRQAPPPASTVGATPSTALRPPPPPVQQQQAPPALSISAPGFQPRPSVAAPPSFQAPAMNAAAPPSFRQQPPAFQAPAFNATAPAFQPPALNVGAPAFQAPGGAAPSHLPPPAPRPALQPVYPQQQQQQQQQQQRQQAPPHLQALPPHLQQSAGGGSGGSGMPAPHTPQQPLQHAAASFGTPQALPPPRVTSLLPPTFGAGVVGRPTAVTRRESTGSSAGPAAAGTGGSDEFSGFSSLTDMLSELTTAAPAAPPRPAYRPAYRPPVGPAPAAAAPVAAAAAAAAPAARAPSPAARFPMPGAPPCPAAAPAAAAAPLPAAATQWSCEVCSYKHEGPEFQFLCCAMCGSPQA